MQDENVIVESRNILEFGFVGHTSPVGFPDQSKQNRMEWDRTGLDLMRWDGTGRDGTGPDGQDRTGQDRLDGIEWNGVE